MTSNIKKYILLFFFSIISLSVAEPLTSEDVDAWKPRYMRKIERDEKKREKQKKKDYIAALKENKQRSLEIQTPEVRKRMKQNVKDANKQIREKRRSNLSRTKHNAKKHR